MLVLKQDFSHSQPVLRIGRMEQGMLFITNRYNCHELGRENPFSFRSRSRSAFYYCSLQHGASITRYHTTVQNTTHSGLDLSRSRDTLRKTRDVINLQPNNDSQLHMNGDKFHPTPVDKLQEVL